MPIDEAPVNRMTKGFIWVDFMFIPLFMSLSGEKIMSKFIKCVEIFTPFS